MPAGPGAGPDPGAGLEPGAVPVPDVVPGDPADAPPPAVEPDPTPSSSSALWSVTCPLVDPPASAVAAPVAPPPVGPSESVSPDSVPADDCGSRSVVPLRMGIPEERLAVAIALRRAADTPDLRLGTAEKSGYEDGHQEGAQYYCERPCHPPYRDVPQIGQRWKVARQGA